MHDSVKAGLCNQLALEHVVPVRDWQLTCKDGCLSVISVIYEHLDAIAARPVTQRTGIVGLSCPCGACDDEGHGICDVVAGGKVAGGCGGDEVLRLLRGDTYRIGVVTIGHACDKHLHFYDLTRLGVHIAQFVTCEVNHQLLSRVVCPREHCRTVLLSYKVLLQVKIELRLAIVIRIALDVLLVQQLARHMEFGIGKLLPEVGKSCEEVDHTGVAVGRRACMEQAFQFWVVLPKKLIYAPTIGPHRPDVDVDRFLVYR